MKRWVVMTTDGTVVAFPPEIYEDQEVAASEAERWGQTLAQFTGRGVEPADEAPWHVGDLTVRLVELEGLGVQHDQEWIGTYWTADGYPDPEALLLTDRAAAVDWVLEPPTGFEPAIDVNASQWFVTATYVDRGEETYAVASQAKQIRTSLSDATLSPPSGHINYEIEVAVSRLQRVETSVTGPRGLSQEGVEDLVEENWTAIAAHVTEDHVITWDLERFVEG
jgi:hypothetical protein